MICLGALLNRFACIYIRTYVTYVCIRLHTCLMVQDVYYIGTVIEGPSNITYVPGLTPLPIELTCSVTGVASWEVNSTAYRLDELDDGDLPGHNRTGVNILVDSPVNNTEYICVSQTNDGSILSDPAYIIIAGEQYAHTYILIVGINFNCFVEQSLYI